MDERVRAFGWVLASGGFFGLLGGAFGALVGHLTWRSGRAAGGAAGLGAAAALARAAGRELPPGRRAALVGAVDGLLFLGALGIAFALLAAAHGRAGWAVFRAPAWAALLLAGGAALFGLLAFGLVRAGVFALAGVFAGGLLGAAAGALVARGDGLVLGSLAGVAAGTLLGLAARPPRGPAPP
jgi:hypothetical protein